MNLFRRKPKVKGYLIAHIAADIGNIFFWGKGGGHTPFPQNTSTKILEEEAEKVKIHARSDDPIFIFKLMSDGSIQEYLYPERTSLLDLR